MKIVPNIIPAAKIYIALRYLNAHKKQILEGRRTENYEMERDGIRKAIRTWSRNLLDSFNIKVNITGQENLPEEGPVVFMANHQGYADIPVCCAALSSIQLGFVAKEELLKVPLYGEWIMNIRSIPIKRSDPRASLRAINEGIEFIEKGFSLVVFPEGTRSQGKPHREFKKGSMKLATKPGVPIIPVTINGTPAIFEERGILTGNKTVDVTIHPPIETKGMSKQEQSELAKRVQEIVQSVLPPELHYVPQEGSSEEE
ncbi:MAG: 1-acyl-sn-glycerol-3-phosphate acyltransferase [Firmicutes bacterium]|nr:1-acyl-sn-glycerol-3-phosphate acyltransferase [Bacillota bacterium]MBQ9972787.1 1-acyl-sn-glycerol-3-phosphate acyltransferase [Bacillota bacterium]